ncbi:hypothetical protein ACJX0J_005469, partial [Zea mays]
VAVKSVLAMDELTTEWHLVLVYKTLNHTCFIINSLQFALLIFLDGFVPSCYVFYEFYVLLCYIISFVYTDPLMNMVLFTTMWLSWIAKASCHLESFLIM